jgi:hypothetical protein
MHHQYGLLFDTLDWYKSHCRPRDSLAYRFGIRGIVLVPPRVRLHVSRRHELYVMA